MYYVYLENVIHLEKYVLCLFGKCYTFREICIMFIWKMLYIYRNMYCLFGKCYLEICLYL